MHTFALHPLLDSLVVYIAHEYPINLDRFLFRFIYATKEYLSSLRTDRALSLHQLYTIHARKNPSFSLQH